ncbi:DUF1269 domain-containing protein [Rhizobium helianthi]|uniref:DUF1269 domain-containing protein n=1 Tax=Rhizobium helianthi TaxID=1132695 RepID=A0ABW4M3L2_9HYPH
MIELIVVSFKSIHDADRVLVQLNEMQKEYLVDLADAVVVLRQPDGKLNLKQSIKLAGAGAASGGISGAFWGSLVGLLFLNPLAGLALGGIIGAGTGALAGKLVDYGIDDRFIRSIGEKLTPGSSALFLLIRKVQPEKVIAELAGFQGTILRTSLAPHQEKKLREALAHAEEEDTRKEEAL